jgi:protein phosphatase
MPHDTVVQPPTKAFRTGAATHVGLVRRGNEDNYLVRPQVGVWAVADGMGGHEAGEVASATVVEALESMGRPVSAPDLLARLEDRILRANTRLREIARSRQGATIGTTVAVLLAYEQFYAVVWSGDSRIYRVRQGGIVQLTRDHTEAQDMVDRGVITREEARTWPRRNVITRAVGVHDDPELELDHGMLEPGDAFVLCSDGLTGHVEDEEILNLIVQEQDAQAACDALVALTLERGATDNVTVVVVRYAAAPAGAGAPGANEIWDQPHA